jgi:hypothetical protein
MDLVEDLMEQVLTGETRELRRQAFVDLVKSDAWRQVLAPHVISKQGYEVQDSFYPDRTTFEQVAPLIASSEEKIHRVLELIGARFTEELLQSVAAHMGQDFVEHALDHLRTAEGERALLLERVLYRADQGWVREPAARRVIRSRLRTDDIGKIQLMVWLSEAGNLTDFLDVIREYPPSYLEEWSSLGRASVYEEAFVNRALAYLGQGPEPLAYLLRLDPVPEAVQERMMAAAKPEWLINGLEVAILEGLNNRMLIPLVEMAVRLGGRHLAVAVAWLNSARLGPELLKVLVEQIQSEGGRNRLSSSLWVQRKPPSANHALEQGRKGNELDPRDAAALVRQLQGPRMLELVEEILEKPWPKMLESVLRPLCAINPEAAERVVTLCRSPNPELARRAREASTWPDVNWPEIKHEEDEVPASFTPLGKPI